MRVVTGPAPRAVRSRTRAAEQAAPRPVATVSAQVPSSGEEDHSLQPSLFRVPAGLMEDHAAATDAAARELAEETGV